MKNCKIERDCEGLKRFTDQRCCPTSICDPECDKKTDPLKCEDPDPEDKCTWGYRLGEEVIKLMIEPL